MPSFVIWTFILLSSWTTIITNPFVEGLSSRQPSITTSINKSRRRVLLANNSSFATTSTKEFSAATRNRIASNGVVSSRPFPTKSHFHSLLSSPSTTTRLKANQNDFDSSSPTNVSSKNTLIVTLASTLSFTILLAKLGLIGSSYTNDIIGNDISATIASTILATLFVKCITTLASKHILQPRDSRKIIHALSAPLFMIVWPLYSDIWGSRLFAALVPFLQGVRLYLAATKRGGEEGNELAGAISRSGEYCMGLDVDAAAFVLDMKSL